MSRPKRSPRVAKAPRSEGPKDAERAAGALWIGLAVVIAVRLVLALTPGMWMWGLNTQRFLDPLMAWAPWVLAAVSLAPFAAKRLDPPFTRLGDALARGAVPVVAALVVLVGLLAWASPDNTRFVGDFLLRQGTVEMAGKPGVLFPQALPLDVLIHYRLPTAFQDSHLLSANSSARLLGVLNAALLALFAARLTRSLGFTGAAALAAWSISVFGGYLGMFTGYSKSLAELAMLAAAIAAFGVSLAREGRGALGLSIAFAVSLALHRSGLAFAIPVVVAFALAARGARSLEGARPFWRRPLTWIAVALPVATLATVVPRVLDTLLHVDIAVHFDPAEAKRAGVLGAAFGRLRVLDLLNLVLLLSPLLPVALAAALTRHAARPPRIESTATGRDPALAVLLALALPLLAVAPFIHPAQGLFRDWDDFAALGVALSVLAAWCVGNALDGARARRWVVVPLALGALMPCMQWLALNSDVDQGMARARAFVTEPPARTSRERAGVWDFLGIRAWRLERWNDSAEAFSHAVEDAPSPRILLEWATAATMAGQLRTAQAVYHRLVEKDPKSTVAWLGLGAVTSRIPDVDDSFWATKKLLELDPKNDGGQELMDYLRKTYPNHP